MGSVFVYPPTLAGYGYGSAVTADGGFGEYATLGLCGELLPTKCEFSQKAGEFGELTLTHPVDASGKWKCLKRGYILKAAVPVRVMPAMDDETDAYIGTVYKYTIRNDATKAERAVYKKRTSNNSEEIICYAPRNASVTVLKRYFTSDNCKVNVVVKKKQYTGFISNDALSTTYTEKTIPTTSSGIESASPSYSVKYQLFRIDSVDTSDSEGGTVSVTARRIVYDLGYFPSVYRTNSEVSAKTAAHGVLNTVLGLREPSQFTVFCDIADTRVGFDAKGKSIIEGFCDPSEGITGRYGAQVLSDDFEVYLLRDAGMDRGVTVRYDKDIAGVKCAVDASDVVTGILPLGQNASGNTLYIDAEASAYIPSGYVQEYISGSGYIREILYKSTTLSATPRRIGIINVSEAKEDTKTEGGCTALNARRRLINAAVEEFEAGCDSPKVSVTVDLATCEDKDFRDLSALFIYDTVRVLHVPLDLDVAAIVSSVTWDVTTDRMTKIDIGAAVELQSSVKGYQLSGGISGAKLLDGTVSGASIADESISARNVTAGTVTTDKIAANAITSSKIQSGEVKASNIDVTNLTADGTFTLNVGNIADTHIHNADIDWAQVVQANIQTLIADMFVLKGTDNAYYKLSVVNGAVVATSVTPTAAQIASGIYEDTPGDGHTRSIVDANMTGAQMESTNPKDIMYVLGDVFAKSIDVGTLTARQAMIDTITTIAINAIGTSLSFYVSKAEQSNYLRLVAGEGVYVGESGSNMQAKIGSSGFDVLEGGITTASLRNKASIIGKLMIYQTSDGGVAFRTREGSY